MGRVTNGDLLMVDLWYLADQLQERRVLAIPVAVKACFCTIILQTKKAWKFSIATLLFKQEIHNFQIDTDNPTMIIFVYKY